MEVGRIEAVKISKKQADAKAVAEYNEFNKTQKIVSDFDKLVAASNKLQAEE